MANKVPGKGTKLQIKISSTFTDIGNRTVIEKDDIDVEMRDVTDLDSTAKAYRPGLPDWGTLTLTIFFDPDDTTHILLRDRARTPTQTIDEWKLIYNTGDTTPPNDDVKGYVKSFSETGMEPNGTLTAKLVIQLTDQYTPTAGTP
jgi:hypothetical protein